MRVRVGGGVAQGSWREVTHESPGEEWSIRCLPTHRAMLADGMRDAGCEKRCGCTDTFFTYVSHSGHQARIHRPAAQGTRELTGLLWVETQPQVQYFSMTSTVSQLHSSLSVTVIKWKNIDVFLFIVDISECFANCFIEAHCTHLIEPVSTTQTELWMNIYNTHTHICLLNYETRKTCFIYKIHCLL